jgi:hypothetical protein
VVPKVRCSDRGLWWAAPPSQSVLTYRFNVLVIAQVYLYAPAATFMSFVSVGETANLAPGQKVAVTTGVGWPLIHNLAEPDIPRYDGQYGLPCR